jgi:hypothetical protein
VPVDRRFGGLWVVENAKIVSWSTYLTPREAVRAARELAGEDARRPRGPRHSLHTAPSPAPEPEGNAAEAPPPSETNGAGDRRTPPDRLRAAAKARARLRRQKAAS